MAALRSTSETTWLWQAPAWPRLRYDTAALAGELGRARLAQGRLLGKSEALEEIDQKPAEEQLWTEQTLATAAIEGERLDPAAVRSSVSRRLGLARHGQAVPRHIEGLLDVMQEAAGAWNQPLNRARLCAWQAALFPTGYAGLQRIVVGEYRSSDEPMRIVSGPLGREVVHYEAVPGVAVAAEMTSFLAWFNGSRHSGQHDGLARAALAHLWFETIHPFEDGNGRVGRAIVDLALAQDVRSAWRMHGLSTRLGLERSAYYDALNAAQRGDIDVTAWVAWFLSVFERACGDSLRVVDESIERGQYWARFRHVPLSEHQRKAINALLDAGRGRFEGGMTPRKFRSLTLTSIATSTRELVDLVDKGMLVRQGAGRAVRYELPMTEWQWQPRPRLRESASD